MQLSISSKITSLAVALFLIVSTVGSQELTRRPYPQNMKPHSVDILWRTDVETETWVEVNERGGEAAVSYHSTVPTAKHEIRVPNLKPDTIYEYRVGFGEDEYLMPEPYWFRTFPEESPRRFEFVAYGDHRNYPTDHRAVVEAILEKIEERGWPRFVVDTGDYTGQGEHPTDFWNEQFFDPARGLIEYSTFFPAIGNHEAHRRPPRIPFRYLDNFSVPTENSGTEYFYSFTFGDAFFVVLDVYATDFATGSKQWEWAKRELDDSDAKWKFAVMHYPIFIHRSGPTVTYGNTEIREHLVPLFERYGVTAVFSGDSHFYQRSEVNGIQYICTGGGGAPLYDPGDGPDYVRASAKVHHYAWIVIDGDRMELFAYDTENNLIDTMTTGYRTAIRPPEPELNFVRRMPADAMSAGASIVVESRDAEGDTTAAPSYRDREMSDSTAKSAVAELEGSGSRFSDNVAGDARYTVRPPIGAAGTYLISVTVPDAGSIAAPRTLFEVQSPGTELIRGRVDLSPAAAGNKWLDIGLFQLAPGAEITFIEVEDEPGRFYADAVKFTQFN